MDTIHSLMQRIFSIYIVKNFADSAFTRYDYCFFVIFIIVFGFNCLRPHKKWVCPIINCLVTVTTTRSNFCDVSNIPTFDTIRTELFKQLIQFTHHSTPISAIMRSISARRTASLATISAISAFNFTISIFSFVSAAST